jgi:hypothetical protein
MPRDYHELPAEAYVASAEPTPSDFAFNDSTPPPDPDFEESGGRFVKGHDPRRHVLTPAELRAGVWAGLASYVEQGGEARNFLRRKTSARASLHRHAEEGPRPARTGRVSEKNRPARAPPFSVKALTAAAPRACPCRP